MLARPHPELLDEAPPQNLPRIFVGNLTAHISDSSLHQLVSRFGTISYFARSKCYSFAHMSLKADEASLMKCTSSLNNVKWFGTSLRVEKARQHYLNRLRNEWDQSSCETKRISFESSNEELVTRTQLPFHNIPKGKHVRFSFPDDESFQLTSRPSALPDHANESQEPVTRCVRIKPSVYASRQNSLQTTLSLFGLSSTQEINGIKPAKRSTQETPPFERENKRPRSVLFQNCQSESIKASQGNSANPVGRHKSKDKAIPFDAKTKLDSRDGHITTISINRPYSIKNAEAVENDPSKIDLERERSSHLQVFRSMFLDHTQPMEKSEQLSITRKDSAEQNLFTCHRRAALYSKLQIPAVDAMPLQTIKRPGSKSKTETTKPSRPDVDLDNHQATTPSTSYRHAALYKKFQLIQHSDAS